MEEMSSKHNEIKKFHNKAILKLDIILYNK